MYALLPIHLIIAGTSIRITTGKLNEGLSICRQIYLNISLLMGIIVVWKIVLQLWLIRRMVQIQLEEKDIGEGY